MNDLKRLVVYFYIHYLTFTQPILLTKTIVQMTDELKKKAIGIVFVILMLLFSGTSLLAQANTVRGTVTNEAGETLPGVNVVVQGTFVGTVTDVNGSYSLEVPLTGNLVFSFIGYRTRIVPIEGQQTINTVLETDLLRLDEIIVVGYGAQRKSDITGAITSVDAERLRDVPSASISRALQGKAAGLEIQSTSTRPGGSTQIRIRGNRSLTASNDPLIVVDGIPFSGSLNDISTDNIESIEILKDASATVIYGSRGANGVILITTRRGQEGELRLTYNAYQGVTNVARRYELFNAEEFVRLRTVAGYTNYLPSEKESLLLGRETDWQDLFYQTGFTSNHEVSLSAGTSRTQYALTGSYFRETGVLPDIAFTRYSMRAAIDQMVGRHVRVGITSINSVSITDGQSANPMFQALTWSPLSPAYNADGTVNERPGWDTEIDFSAIVLRDQSRWKEQNRRFASFNVLYGEINLARGLKNRINLGIDFADTKYNNFFGSNTPFRNGRENTAQVQSNDNFAYTIENLLTYENTFAGRHRITLTGMASAQESTTTSSRLDATGIPADFLQFNNLSLADVVEAPADNNFFSRWSLVSFMARVNYAFDDRYLLTITGRTDGSSRLSPGNKWHTYPAMALGWNIMNEDFMQNVRIVENLRLRVGYGQTSNTAINPYATLGGLTGSFYSFGDRGVRGYYVTTLPNADLGWEYTTTTNAGIDFGFLNGRVTGSVDYYIQRTHDLLLGKALPPSMGVPGQFMVNVGETKNRGLEVVLNGVVVSPNQPGDFGWELNTNVFFNREEIVALQDPAITKDIGNGWFVGHPSSAIFDYVKTGIWQLDEAAEAATFGAAPGDLKLLDFAGGGANGDEPDGRITDVDRRIIGSGQPDFQGGFTSTFRFRGFDLSVVSFFRFGSTIISNLHMPGDYVNRLDGRRNGIRVDYWSPENPTNDMPRPRIGFDAARTSVLGYFDGSFMKIRSINLGYDLDQGFAGFLGANSGLRIFASITDPFLLFSPYVEAGGVDPEPNRTGNTIQGGEGVPARALRIGLDTPPTRKIIVGFNYRF